MADISAIFFILLMLGIAFPAMLAAWWLLFPALISRAQSRVEKTPMQTFWLGLVIVIAVTLPIVILFALPFGPAKFIGWILLAASLAISSIGSAGVAAHLGARLTSQSGLSALNGFIRGTIILELTAFFPVLGWFFLWPLLLITAFGATGFALLNWIPREKASTETSMQVNKETGTQVNPNLVTRNS
ncbi:MAG: hypothetical protein HYZ23_10500 [Chloroflexi bacterium]|nr:hypothetical protein [Chloroflexota bacterium]